MPAVKKNDGKSTTVASMIRYSILIVSKNMVTTVYHSLKSMVDQLDDSYEIIIVDSNSSDGTYEILNRFSNNKDIHLIKWRCSRGTGRQIGLLHSKGEYIISQLDLDEILRPVLKKYLKVYHEQWEGKMMLIDKEPDSGLFYVAPRKMLLELGGYRDLDYLEEIDLFFRASKQNKLVYLPCEEYIVRYHEKCKNPFKLFVKAYQLLRDSLRIRETIKFNIFMCWKLPLLPIAMFGALIKRRYNNDKTIRIFNARRYLNKLSM